MDFKEILSYWKIVATFAVVLVGATVSVLTWAEDQKTLIRAEQQLIHNDSYQESKIERKSDQIREDERELKRILSSVGDDEPTPRESREIDALDDNIKTLKQDVEDIKTKLNE